MIRLDTNSTTTATSTRNGVTQTSVTDTLVVKYVELNLVQGSILAIIDRGQAVTVLAIPAQDYVPAVLDADGNVLTPEVPAVAGVPAHTDFTPTDTSLWVDVNSDGSFRSRDGAWVGTVSTGPQILAGLKQAFDQFLLAGGAVTGTII